MTSRLLQPGRNCWRIAHAERVAFLVDGHDYFRAVHQAISQARHSILLLGWDIDSRVRLVSDEEAGEFPGRLGEFLDAVVSRRPGLHAHVLIWDFAMIYAFEREWLSVYKLGWQTHERLHFRLDSHHPTGASHHQKIVVVDDAVAFVGGFDLTKWRWDHPDHRWHDPRRVDAEGIAYPPFHDVQCLVSGPAAAALAELARERWRAATGERLSAPAPAWHAPWPDVPPDLENIPVGIARTFPRLNRQPPITEVAQLFVDSIAAAQDFIYIENQYFTSRRIAQALTERLGHRHPPEIVMVLPKKTSGWLEQYTMDVLRSRVLAQLRGADRQGRLRIYYPQLGPTAHQFLNVHSKVMVIDDRLLRVGSANLSNRSMGFDTECDLFFEADPSLPAEPAFARLRNRLLAEHLGVSEPRIVAETFRQEDSLIATVERLRDGQRTLNPLDGRVSVELDAWIPDAEMIDPERPLEAEMLVNHVVDHHEQKTATRHLLRNLSALLVLLLLAAAWRWTPMREWLDLERIRLMLSLVEQSAFGPLVVAAGFVIGGLIAVPVTLLIVVTILTFGPLLGFIYSLAGAMLSAVVTYGIGHRLGHDLVRRFAGTTVNRLSERLAQRGVLAVVIVRIIPVAPYTIVNIVAGASHIQFRDFAIGTALGLLPGLLALTLFVDRLEATLSSPNLGSFAILAAVIGLLALGAFLVRRWLLRRERNMPKEAPPPE